MDCIDVDVEIGTTVSVSVDMSEDEWEELSDGEKHQIIESLIDWDDVGSCLEIQDIS